MKEIIFFIKILILLFTFFISTSICKDRKVEFLQGFNKVIQRGDFSYHSPHPDITKALLVRAKKEEMVIEWQTETVPKDYKDDFVSFIWYFGIDHNAVNHSFDLQINNQSFLKFKNDLGSKIGSWEVNGKNNSKLTFKATMVDKYNDLMGIAILRLHISDCILGTPLNIKIIGEDSDSYVWYMTFQGQVSEEIQILSTDFIVRGEKENYQLAKVNMVHLGNAEKIKIETDSGFQLNSKINIGYNSFDIKIPVKFVNKKINVKIIIANNAPIEKVFLVSPIREWYINFVMHSHTDIGYTRPQTEILPEHLRYIDYALDFCDLTDHYPEDAKFRWTCENTWAVQKYLTSRPKSQINRLIKRVNEGRIELMGMLFNISEIPDESLLASMLKPIKELRAQGLKINAAMQNDINGIAWSHVDYFKGADIKYLIMGEHAHRARIPFDYPTVFWWESPAGNKILAYRAEHYMTGNSWGIHTGDMELIQLNLRNYLYNLGKTSYPYNKIHIQMSGYMTDNSPPSSVACDFVKTWNEYFEWPKMRIATASEFMKEIEADHSNSLPIYKAAWPDWWSDGFGSAARETMEARRTQSDLIANKGLLSMALIMGADIPENIFSEISKIEEDLAFYMEHTFGADESIRDPYSENSMVQWMQKSSFVWDAVKNSRILKEKAMGFIQQFLPKSNYPTVAIFNTLNWNRSGLVNVYIDHQIIPQNKKFNLVDFDGNKIFAQPNSSRSDGTYWSIWADNIPAFGYKLFNIIVENDILSFPSLDKSTAILENDFYKIIVNKSIGAIEVLLDKETNKNIVDVNSKWKFGQIIYEELSNRTQLERYTLDTEPIRTSLTDITFGGIKKGPIWNSLYLSGKNEKCSGKNDITLEIRLYNFEKRIDLNYSLVKLPVSSPEALYVAFPFELDNSKITYEAQGGIVEPGKDQLAGTSSDWNVIQNFASIKNDNFQIIFASNDIPLAQLGGLNIGEFNYFANPETSHIYSWVMNNYWVTNFRASQEGEHKWSYSLTTKETKTNEKSYKFGYENRIPFAARIFPTGKQINNSFSKSFLQLEIPNIILVSANIFDTNRKILIHLKEINGEYANINLTSLVNAKVKEIYETNILGEKLNTKNELLIKPFDTKFVLVEFENNLD